MHPGGVEQQQHVAPGSTPLRSVAHGGSGWRSVTPARLTLESTEADDYTRVVIDSDGLPGAAVRLWREPTTAELAPDVTAAEASALLSLNSAAANAAEADEPFTLSVGEAAAAGLLLPADVPRVSSSSESARDSAVIDVHAGERGGGDGGRSAATAASALTHSTGSSVEPAADAVDLSRGRVSGRHAAAAGLATADADANAAVQVEAAVTAELGQSGDRLNFAHEAAAAGMPSTDIDV